MLQDQARTALASEPAITGKTYTGDAAPKRMKDQEQQPLGTL